MSSPRHSLKHGFTLVELLVVIAIIALLISILLPSLGLAKEQGRKIKCLANMRDLGNASLTYANSDPSEILVPTPRRTGYSPVYATMTWFWGQTHFGGRGGDPDLTGNWDWRHAWTAFAGFGPGERPLNTVLFKNPTWESWEQARAKGNPFIEDDPRLDEHARLDMPGFHCPSDVGLPRDKGVIQRDADGPYGREGAWIPQDTPFYDIMGNSYLTHWCTPLFKDPATGKYLGAGAVKRQLGAVPNPARCVIYREGNAKDVEFHNGIKSKPPPYQFGVDLRVMGWHGKEMTFNATFADGHSSEISHLVRTDATGISDDGSEVYHNGKFQLRGCRPEAVRLPYNDPYADPGMATLIMRGEGWQLDFFPSPPVIVFNR